MKLSVFLTSLLLLSGFATNTNAAPPNILVIMADDCTYNDLPLYGGQNAKTPNLDQLASQGLTFNKAYLAEAMCQPCRAELYTGQYPVRNGCAWNHSASRPETRSMPNYLTPLGYRVGLAGKLHVKPTSAFPFDPVPGFDPNCVRNPTAAHDLEGVRSFIADKEKPFCLTVALVEPHVPWVMGDASAYPPKKIKLPANIADTPRTREDFGNYLAEITYMDGQVGEILKTLDDAGQADNTLVLFTSEQGSQFPGCKWTNFDTGIHTALVARWPGVVPVGKRTDAMVQYTDILPTLLELAGADLTPAREPGPTLQQESPFPFNGTSFVKVLRSESETHRTYTYGCHNNVPEGPPYPIRTISDGSHRLILNLRPDEVYLEKHLMGGGRKNNPYWSTWMQESFNSPATYALIKRFMHRPAVELYHTAKDPYEMTNLADKKPELVARLKTELEGWMTRQGDPGAPQDTREALQAARKGEHLFPVEK